MKKKKGNFIIYFLAGFGVLALLLIILLEPIYVRRFEQPDEEANILYLRLAAVHNKSYPTVKGAIEFARRVNEQSNGQIVIEVSCDKQLGTDETAIAEQLQFGAIDMACISTSALCRYAPPLQVLELPFLFENGAHMHNVLDSSIGGSLLKSGEENGIVGLAFYDAGEQLYCNANHMVTRPSDMNELRMGVMPGPLSADYIEAMGAKAYNFPYGDIYRLLQTNRINGVECNIIDYVSNRYYVEACYLTQDHHSMQPYMLVCSDMIFETLSEEYKQLIKKAAIESVPYQRSAFADSEENAWILFKQIKSELTVIKNKKEFEDVTIPLEEKMEINYASIIKKIRSMQ